MGGLIELPTSDAAMADADEDHHDKVGEEAVVPRDVGEGDDAAGPIEANSMTASDVQALFPPCCFEDIFPDPTSRPSQTTSVVHNTVPGGDDVLISDDDDEVVWVSDLCRCDE